MKCWSGNSDDTTIFQQRARALVEAWKETGIPPCFITDSKGYTKDNAVNLKQLCFITRIPETITLAKDKIEESLQSDTWQVWDEARKYH